MNIDYTSRAGERSNCGMQDWDCKQSGDRHILASGADEIRKKNDTMFKTNVTCVVKKEGRDRPWGPKRAGGLCPAADPGCGCGRTPLPHCMPVLQFHTKTYRESTFEVMK